MEIADFNGALPLPLSVQAADMPKSGTDSYTVTWVTTSSNSVKMGDCSFDTYEDVGVLRNDTGGAMFNNFAIRIVGSGEIAGKERVDRGAEAMTDKDGDQIFCTWEGKTVEGHEFGPFSSLAAPGSSPVSRGQENGPLSHTSPTRTTSVPGVVTKKVTWKLP